LPRGRGRARPDVPISLAAPGKYAAQGEIIPARRSENRRFWLQRNTILPNICADFA
jgi:hypothetical protein